MHSSTAARPSIQTSSKLQLAGAAAIMALVSLLPGCCESWEGEVCGVMDPEVTQCPSDGDFEAASGGEVIDGPETRYYVDMRSDASEARYGMLCCYKVKHTTCNNNIKVY